MVNIISELQGWFYSILNCDNANLIYQQLAMEKHLLLLQLKNLIKSYLTTESRVVTCN